jgi:hypothetical protein
MNGRYRCVVEIRIPAADGTIRGVKEDLDLPFVPYPGLRIAGISDDPDGERIEGVTWDTQGKQFYVDLETREATEARMERLSQVLAGDWGPGWRWREEERQ